MQVTEDQKKAIGEWIHSGADLGKVQQSLKEEFELTLTYLDTRFLLADLGLALPLLMDMPIPIAKSTGK